MLLEMKNSLSKQKYEKYEKNVNKQNYSPPEDQRIHFRQLFNRNK